MIVCGEPIYAEDQRDTLTNPTVIIEVLSDSTRDYDRGRKFQYYRTLPSLIEYLCVDQDAVHVEHHTRQADQGWLLTEADDLSAKMSLTSIGVDLALADVYAKITL
jgi:Uma2 family endonuclease